MSLAFATERRLLAEEELDPIRRSHFPLLEALSRAEVQELLRWLRARRDRARDLMRDHRRSKRGKGTGRRRRRRMRIAASPRRSRSSPAR